MTSVGVDATALFRSEPTGVDRAARGWVTALAGVRPGWELTLAGWRGTQDTERPLHLDPAPALRVAPAPRYAYRLAELARLPVPIDALTHLTPDAWFFPDFVRLPLARRRPSLTVVHDLSFLIAERFSHRMHRSYLARQTRRALDLGSVAVVSDTVARELADTYEVDRNRIAVLPNAVDHEVFAPATRERVTDMRERLALDRPYVVSVGALHDRKNLVRLIEAYAQLGVLAEDTDLVLAGSTNRHSTTVLHTIAAYRGPGRVRHLGFVNDDDLPSLYGGADVVAIPSLYEGFGLPVLEAMACGASVLTSSGGALQEVGGSAAEYADPRDVASIAAGLRLLLTDESRRSELREAGVARAQLYTWRQSGEILAGLLESLL